MKAPPSHPIIVLTAMAVFFGGASPHAHQTARSQRHHDARAQGVGPREQHPQQRHKKICLHKALMDLVQHHVTEVLQVRPGGALMEAQKGGIYDMLGLVWVNMVFEYL